MERFLALLEALGDHRTWYRAIPAAYGIPAQEFEADWRVWLAGELGGGGMKEAPGQADAARNSCSRKRLTRLSVLSPRWRASG